MKLKGNSIHQNNLFLSAALAIGIATVASPASAAQEMDHSAHAMGHQMHDHGMAMGGGMEDHAQHMQALKAMQNQEYQRSVMTYPLPQMELVDMHGDKISLDEMLNTDQPVMVNFIYTSCTTICPIMSATFSQAQKQMGKAAKPVKWVSISIDPEYDTPARLREYAERFHADSNWDFITGDVDKIVALQKAFNVYHGSKMNHKPVTFMRSGRDQPWVRLDGLTSGAELVAEYQHIAQK